MKRTYLYAAVVIVIIAVAAAYALWPRPSIKVSSVIVPSEFAKVGEQFNVTVRASNTGGASGTYNIQLKLDGTVLFSREATARPREFVPLHGVGAGSGI